MLLLLQLKDSDLSLLLLNFVTVTATSTFNWEFQTPPTHTAFHGFGPQLPLQPVLMDYNFLQNSRRKMNFYIKQQRRITGALPWSPPSWPWLWRRSLCSSESSSSAWCWPPPPCWAPSSWVFCWVPSRWRWQALHLRCSLTVVDFWNCERTGPGYGLHLQIFVYIYIYKSNIWIWIIFNNVVFKKEQEIFLYPSVIWKEKVSFITRVGLREVLESLEWLVEVMLLLLLLMLSVEYWFSTLWTVVVGLVEKSSWQLVAVVGRTMGRVEVPGTAAYSFKHSFLQSQREKDMTLKKWVKKKYIFEKRL